MTSRWICALLGLVMALSLAGCGNQTAGANASRWRQSAEVQNNALYQRDLADGTGLDADGKAVRRDGDYRADDRGQVAGFRRDGDRDSRSAATKGGKVEKDLKNAGSDLKNAVRDAARSVGDAAEDAMDGMKDAADNAESNIRSAKR